MAIQSVRIQLNGEWRTAALDPSTGLWMVTVAAPMITSYGLPGNYYPIGITATNDINFTVAIDHTHVVFGNSLRLTVKERIAPRVNITVPQLLEFLPSVRPPISFELRDEPDGSGIDLGALEVKLNREIYGQSSPGMVIAPAPNGYDCTFTPQSDLPYGENNMSITVRDIDGNLSSRVYAIFYTYSVLDLITDRTVADVLYAAMNRDAATPNKGAYNASDFNRVAIAFYIVREWLFQFGYGTDLGGGANMPLRKDWTVFNNMSYADAVNYLGRIQKLKTAFLSHLTAPLPAHIHDIFNDDGYIHANNIEKLLEDLAGLAQLLYFPLWYSGEPYSGEDF